jgi:uncharacterized protein
VLGDIVVVDAVAHCLNFDPQNLVNPDRGENFRAGFWENHKRFSLPAEEYVCPRDAYLSEFKPAWTAHALFAESGVDMAIYHATPIYDFFKDGLSSVESGWALRDLAPGRVLVYGSVNPLDGPRAIERMNDLHVRGIDGIKLYPAMYYSGRTIGWRMDDPEVMFPIFEHARALGIRNIAVHKAVAVGPSRPEPYGVNDVAGAAAMFPDLNFQVVHGGVTFVDDTAMLLKTFKNVYVNLEITFNYLLAAPRRFAEVIGQLIDSGSSDQLLFSSGCNWVHPQPVLAAFEKFKMPQDLVEGYGYQQLTDDDRRKILGGNAARIHGIDLEPLAKGLADVWDSRREHGLQPPWSGIK